MSTLKSFIQAVLSAIKGEISASEIFDYTHYLNAVQSGDVIEFQDDAVFAESGR